MPSALARALSHNFSASSLDTPQMMKNGRIYEKLSATYGNTARVWRRLYGEAMTLKFLTINDAANPPQY